MTRTQYVLTAIGLSITVAACGNSDPLTVTEAQTASGSQSVVGLLVARRRHSSRVRGRARVVPD